MTTQVNACVSCPLSRAGCSPTVDKSGHRVYPLIDAAEDCRGLLNLLQRVLAPTFLKVVEPVVEVNPADIEDPRPVWIHRGGDSDSARNAALKRMCEIISKNADVIQRLSDQLFEAASVGVCSGHRAYHHFTCLLIPATKAVNFARRNRQWHDYTCTRNQVSEEGGLSVLALWLILEFAQKAGEDIRHRSILLPMHEMLREFASQLLKFYLPSSAPTKRELRELVEVWPELSQKEAPSWERCKFEDLPEKLDAEFVPIFPMTQVQESILLVLAEEGSWACRDDLSIAVDRDSPDRRPTEGSNHISDAIRPLIDAGLVESHGRGRNSRGYRILSEGRRIARLLKSARQSQAT